MNLKEAQEDFVRAKTLENCSEKTLQLYNSMTDELVGYVGEIPLSEYSAEDVRGFLSFQRNRKGRFGKLSDATMKKYYSVIRTFSRWLKDQGYKSISATEKVPAPRVEEKLPESLTDDELERLYLYLQAYCSRRIMLVFQFFLDTGARLNEVVGINVEDVHREDGWVKVYGKGRRERILPLGRKLEQELSIYLSSIRTEIAEVGESALFVTQQGTRYTADGMATLIKTKLKKIGVQGSYGPHKLRHTFATNYLRNGGGLEQLRRIMGHRDISTTQRYLALLPEDLYKAHRDVSPNDSIMRRIG